MIKITNIRYVFRGEERSLEKNKRIQSLIADKLKEVLEKEYKKTHTTADFEVII